VIHQPGKQAGNHDGRSYPLLRLVAVAADGMRTIIDSVFGPASRQPTATVSVQLVPARVTARIALTRWPRHRSVLNLLTLCLLFIWELYRTTPPCLGQEGSFLPQRGGRTGANDSDYAPWRTDAAGPTAFRPSRPGSPPMIGSPRDCCAR
jgi:hypothetical protein